jgi:hypothetical protein
MIRSLTTDAGVTASGLNDVTGLDYFLSQFVGFVPSDELQRMIILAKDTTSLCFPQARTIPSSNCSYYKVGRGRGGHSDMSCKPRKGVHVLLG